MTETAMKAMKVIDETTDLSELVCEQGLLRAWCWRSGEIEFGPEVPKGAMALGAGRPETFYDEVAVAVRKAWDGETLLLPGVPEAVSDEAARLAVVGWLAWRSGDRVKATEIAAERLALQQAGGAPW